jgi:hypothetical protein
MKRRSQKVQIFWDGGCTLHVPRLAPHIPHRWHCCCGWANQSWPLEVSRGESTAVKYQGPFPLLCRFALPSAFFAHVGMRPCPSGLLRFSVGLGTKQTFFFNFLALFWKILTSVFFEKILKNRPRARHHRPWHWGITSRRHWLRRRGWRRGIANFTFTLSTP